MEIKLNTDELSSCNECLNREEAAEVIITVSGLSLKLCKTCKLQLVEALKH